MLRAVGRFWLVRAFWLLVAMVVLIAIAHVPEGIVVTRAVDEQSDGNFYVPKPAPAGFFVIEPWELRERPASVSVEVRWDFATFRAAAVRYASDLIKGDLTHIGRLGQLEKTWDSIKPATVKTLQLFGLGIFSGTLLGVVAGMLTHAARPLRPPLLGFAVGGLSVPDFLLVLSGQLLTVWTYKTYRVRLWSVGVPDGERHWVLPALALSLPIIAYVLRLTMASLDDIMREDYIRTARAKGVSRWGILLGHALRNAVPRILNGLPALVNVTLSSLVVIEYLTSWQGLGLMMAPWSGFGIGVRLTAALVYAVWFAVVEGLAQTLRLVANPRLREVRA